MEFGYTAEEEAFRETIRSFVEQEWGPPEPSGRPQEDDRERELAFRRKVADQGWLSLGWPSEHGGGTTVGRLDRYILSQEMTRCAAPFPLYIANVIGPLLLQYGGEELKEELLPRVRSGDVNFVLGFTEPETGSDLANLQTRAIREGDNYVINGQKMYGRPREGDIMYLAVRTDPDAPIRKGISILLVDYPTEGMTATTMPTLGGMEVGATFYDDVVIPRHRLLGEENDGWKLVREAMDLDRAAGIAYGHLPVLFEAIIDYTRTTERNGRPLMELPAVREGIARLAMDVEAAKVIQDMAASKTAAGLDVHGDAAVLKVFCTELESRLSNFAMELVGQVGPVLDESAGLHPLVRAANRAQRLNVAITIAGGTNEIQRNIIATQALGMAREPRPAQ